MEKISSYNDLTFDERFEWLKDNLKDGMYVRTYCGIDRFNYKFKRENHDFYCYCFEKKEVTNPEHYLEKEPSYDIIDLIEVGDYVNGVEVKEINDKEIMLVDTHLWIDKKVANRLIESIVTKEQFELMKYEVKND